ncbi:hypothetical protein Hanom_Chr03g00270331 [Helianthus anomalus]
MKTNEHKQAFTNIDERTQPMFMFVHLTKRTKFLVRVRLFIKQTNTNGFPAAQFMKRALSV